MIEVPGFPVLRVVAKHAVFTQLAFMGIIFLVATVTTLRHQLKAGTIMTLLAGQGGMGTIKRVGINIVIKVDFLMPIFIAMALCTVVTQVILVNIIKTMTGDTGTDFFVVIVYSLAVAELAIGLGVFMF